MGNDDAKKKMGNDDHSHITAFLMGFRRVRSLILKRFDNSSKVLTSVSQYDSKPWSWAPRGGRFAPETPLKMGPAQWATRWPQDPREGPNWGCWFLMVVILRNRS